VTRGSKVLEAAAASAIAAEIIARLALARNRPLGYWLILSLDVVSILTIFPQLRFFALARAVRGAYASLRLIVLLDRLARRAKQAAYLIFIFPLVVPLMAAIVYAFEYHAPHCPIRTYLQALSICFSFALSLGNIRPVTAGAMAVCGTLFLLGILCIGILTNSISLRYASSND